MPEHRAPAWGLGLDVGGSASRWALVSRDTPAGQAVLQGELPGLTGLLLDADAGRAAWSQALAPLAATLVAAAGGPLHGVSLRVLAGVTGLGAGTPAAGLAQQLLATALAVPASQLVVTGDIDLACDVLLPRGEGVLLYAGTGSIAVHRDAQGVLHRAGGRGFLLDDAGGGHWIARQALRGIWRGEDAAPGSGAQSRLARCVFEQLGGSDWSVSRDRIYRASRGELGLLSLAVARAARAEHGQPGDRRAQALLRRAGTELADVACRLLARVGAQPVVLAGRAFDLHPLVESAARRRLAQAIRRFGWPPFGVSRTQDAVHLLAAHRAVQGQSG